LAGSVGHPSSVFVFERLVVSVGRYILSSMEDSFIAGEVLAVASLVTGAKATRPLAIGTLATLMLFEA